MSTMIRMDRRERLDVPARLRVVKPQDFAAQSIALGRGLERVDCDGGARAERRGGFGAPDDGGGVQRALTKPVSVRCSPTRSMVVGGLRGFKAPR